MLRNLLGPNTNFYLAKQSEVLILLHEMETHITHKTRIWNTFADDQEVFHIRVYTVLNISLFINQNYGFILKFGFLSQFKNNWHGIYLRVFYLNSKFCFLLALFKAQKYCSIIALSQAFYRTPNPYFVELYHQIRLAFISQVCTSLNFRELCSF